MERMAKVLEKRVELIIVIMLGITAVFTAWASWVGSLHEGNQATNYAEANNLAAEGNSEYNAGVQRMNQDMILWNDVSDLQIEILFAQDSGDEDQLAKSAYKLFFKLDDNLSDDMASVLGWDFNYTSDDPEEIVLAWMDKEEALVSPFTEEAFVASYFTAANDLLAESQQMMLTGQEDNKNGDAFGLVTVIYGVVLFLLGIAGSFKNKKNTYFIVAVSFISFIIATIYMISLPVPDGFGIMSFFAAS